MTNSKTRLRVARIAAGAVFAAGASLTVVGTAQAVDLGLVVTASDDESETIAGVTTGSSGTPSGTPTDPGTPSGTPTDPGTPSGTPTDPGTPSGTPSEPGTGGSEGTSGTGGSEGTSGTGGSEGTSGTGGSEGTSGTGGSEGTSGTGGSQGTESTGGSGSPATTGGTGGTGGGDDSTCVIDGVEVDCDEAGGPAPDGGGQEPISAPEPQAELAETGSGQTAFLIVGAATMIAGGVGFRLLPRLANSGGGAAAA